MASAMMMTMMMARMASLSVTPVVSQMSPACSTTVHAAVRQPGNRPPCRAPAALSRGPQTETALSATAYPSVSTGHTIIIHRAGAGHT